MIKATRPTYFSGTCTVFTAQNALALPRRSSMERKITAVMKVRAMMIKAKFLMVSRGTPVVA
ncbi:hypothetical protein [Candidatus Darwinibacter acetoxidans]